MYKADLSQVYDFSLRIIFRVEFEVCSCERLSGMQLLDGDTCPLSFLRCCIRMHIRLWLSFVDIQDDRVRTFLFVAGGQRDFITAFSAQGRFPRVDNDILLCTKLTNV